MRKSAPEDAAGADPVATPGRTASKVAAASAVPAAASAALATTVAAISAISVSDNDAIAGAFGLKTRQRGATNVSRA